MSATATATDNAKWTEAYANEVRSVMMRALRLVGGETGLTQAAQWALQKYMCTCWVLLGKIFRKMGCTDLGVADPDEFKQRFGCSWQAARNAGLAVIEANEKNDHPSIGYDLERLDDFTRALVRHRKPECKPFLDAMGAGNETLLMLMAASKAKLKTFLHNAVPDAPDYIVDRIMDFARELRREKDRKTADYVKHLAMQQHEELKRREHKRRNPDETDSDDEAAAHMAAAAAADDADDATDSDDGDGDHGDHHGAPAKRPKLE